MTRLSLGQSFDATRAKKDTNDALRCFLYWRQLNVMFVLSAGGGGRRGCHIMHALAMVVHTSLCENRRGGRSGWTAVDDVHTVWFVV